MVTVSFYRWRHMLLMSCILSFLLSCGAENNVHLSLPSQLTGGVPIAYGQDVDEIVASGYLQREFAPSSIPLLTGQPMYMRYDTVGLVEHWVQVLEKSGKVSFVHKHWQTLEAAGKDEQISSELEHVLSTLRRYYARPFVFTPYGRFDQKAVELFEGAIEVEIVKTVGARLIEFGVTVRKKR